MGKRPRLARSRIFHRSRLETYFDDSGHLLFYNYAFEVLAIDALPRNCYIKDGNLLPFDVILCHPNSALQDFLKPY